MKPATPELDALTDQLGRIQGINGGADWHTDIGTRASLSGRPEEEPPEHVYWAGLETATQDWPAMRVTITWGALIRASTTETIEVRALKVLADLRAAIVDDCSPEHTEGGATYEPREPGSHYARVLYTVHTTATQ